MESVTTNAEYAGERDTSPMSFGGPVEEFRELRIGDADRQAVIDSLREAVGEGRLTLDEFADRAGTTYAASTAQELRAVLHDLPPSYLPARITETGPRGTSRSMLPPPAPQPRPAPTSPPSRPVDRATGSNQTIVAVMSEATRKGRWRAEPAVTVVAVMGGAKLDFCDAELAAAVVDVRAVTVMGGIDIVVPLGIPVLVDGFVLMGPLEDRTDASASSPMREQGPMIRVHGYGICGGITVRNPTPKDERRQQKEAARQQKLEARRAAVPMAHRLPAAPPVPIIPAPPIPRLPGVPFPPSVASDRAPAPVAAPPSPTTDPPSPVAEPEPLGGTVTLLFTDIVDSSVLAQALGDQRWMGVLQTHNALVREQIARHGGREIKTQGDGFMIAFTSARRALLAAIGVQRALATYRSGHPETDLHVRIGLHTGEVIADNGDLYGRNVILASRIAAEAGRDEVLASGLTKQLADAGGDLGFGPERVVELKGLTGDWVVHRVDWN